MRRKKGKYKKKVDVSLTSAFASPSVSAPVSAVVSPDGNAFQFRQASQDGSQELPPVDKVEVLSRYFGGDIEQASHLARRLDRREKGLEEGREMTPICIQVAKKGERGTTAYEVITLKPEAVRVAAQTGLDWTQVDDFVEAVLVRRVR